MVETGLSGELADTCFSRGAGVLLRGGGVHLPAGAGNFPVEKPGTEEHARASKKKAGACAPAWKAHWVRLR